MNYKEIPNFECSDEHCWFRDGENCKLDLERFNELQSNDTLKGLKCMENYFCMQKIRRHLENHQPQAMAAQLTFSGYRQYKEELDTELRKTTEGFVKIGYLLKVAKDTDILKESGYANVYEFAQAEYNIDKSQVSRFMNINDRFSEGGYSDRLKEHFRGFGHAKLTIMLQLPDEINEELNPDFSKSEIQAIKEEYDEESRISDLEVLMEGQDQQQQEMESNLFKVLHQLGKEEPELYVNLFMTGSAIEAGDMAAVQEVLAPDGEKIYSIRIMGVGRLMMSIKGIDRPITLTNMRTAEKEDYTWEETISFLKMLMRPGEAPAESWENTYGEAFPKKAEVAPVQPQSEEKQKQAPKKESKVSKAKKPEPKKEEPEEEPEEQLPGQDNIMNHPEYLPEEMKKKQEQNNAAEGLNSEKQGGAHQDAHHRRGDDTEGEAAGPDGDEESDAAAGVGEDSETETLQNITEDTEIVQELPGNPENIWDRATIATAKLNLFFRNWSVEDLENGAIPAEALQTAYKNAVAVAADLERMINNVKEHNA